MARNEDGEFELMLGNKQLLSVFFLMVLLLCLCFVGGYLLGRSAAPVLSASNEADGAAQCAVAESRTAGHRRTETFQCDDAGAGDCKGGASARAHRTASVDREG